MRGIAICLRGGAVSLAVLGVLGASSNAAAQQTDPSLEALRAKAQERMKAEAAAAAAEAPAT